jgi:hypothetical protein
VTVHIIDLDEVSELCPVARSNQFLIGWSAELVPGQSLRSVPTAQEGVEEPKVMTATPACKP